MKSILFPLALLIPVGCGDSAAAASTHEGVARQVTGTLEEMVEVLESATDDASVEAAKIEIAEIADRLENLAARMLELGEPDAVTLERITTEMEGAMQNIGAKMVGIAMKALSDPKLQELLQVLTDAMEGMPNLGK